LPFTILIPNDEQIKHISLVWSSSSLAPFKFIGLNTIGKLGFKVVVEKYLALIWATWDSDLFNIVTHPSGIFTVSVMATTSA